jgi:hypothetical protein
MSDLLNLAIGLYAVNGALFSVLAFIYGRTAFSTRAKYPLGLLIFSLLLVFQTFGTAWAYLSFPNYILGEVHPLMAIMAAFEFVGAAVLLKTTL